MTLLPFYPDEKILDEIYCVTNFLAGISWLILLGLSAAFRKRYSARSAVFSWIRPTTFVFEIFFLISAARHILNSLMPFFPALGFSVGTLYIVNNICLGVACGYASVYYRRGPVFLERLARHKANSRRFESLSEVVIDGILEFDPYGIIWYANSSAARIFGTGDQENLLGTHFSDYLTEPERSTTENDFRALVEAKQSVRATGLRDGKEFPMEVTIAEYEFQHQTRYCVVVRDVSYRTELEKKLCAARDAL